MVERCELMGRVLPPETKARAIALLATGQSANSIAAELGVDERTVRRWRRDTPMSAITEQKQADLNALVTAYLHEVLETLTAQARFARDETWLRTQSANDVAILHGVINDKAIRILAALQPPPAAESGGAEIEVTGS